MKGSDILKRFLTLTVIATTLMLPFQASASVGKWHHFRKAWLSHRNVLLIKPFRVDPDWNWRRYERQVLHRAYARWQYRVSHPALKPVEHFVRSAPVQTQHYNYGSGGCASGYVHDLILRNFAPSQQSEAFFVARRESDCDPFAKNKNSSASGVYQIVDSTWHYWSYKCGYGGSSVFSASANVGTAACMVDNGGWGPWGG
jgi:hypothetical protein